MWNLANYAKIMPIFQIFFQYASFMLIMRANFVKISISELKYSRFKIIWGKFYKLLIIIATFWEQLI